MESKKALEEWYETMSTNDKIRWEDNYLSIKKAFEILEIIKKWSFIEESYKEGYGPYTKFQCIIHTIGMEEDFKKIKEWLDE